MRGPMDSGPRAKGAPRNDVREEMQKRRDREVGRGLELLCRLMGSYYAQSLQKMCGAPGRNPAIVVTD